MLLLIASACSRRSILAKISTLSFETSTNRHIGCPIRFCLRMASSGSGETVWYQREVSISPKRRGCHYISKEINSACSKELSHIKIGVAHIHVKHTSASITLQENYDPTVLTDMEMVLNKVVPENLNYKHDMEGPDDMPAHAKAALIGTNVTIPITDGKFNLGTWQGVWLCEHRDHGGSRKLVVTMNGLKK